MKVRDGFVSNSSSTAFIIVNTTDKPLPLSEFVRENAFLLEEYGRDYDWGRQATAEGRTEMLREMLADADICPPLRPGENPVIFGDEDGTTLGGVYDYALRAGGDSGRFKWWFVEYLR